MPVTNSVTLRIAIQACGLTNHEAAEMLGLQPSRLDEILSDNKIISTEWLTQLEHLSGLIRKAALTLRTQRSKYDSLAQATSDTLPDQLMIELGLPLYSGCGRKVREIVWATSLDQKND